MQQRKWKACHGGRHCNTGTPKAFTPTLGEHSSPQHGEHSSPQPGEHSSGFIWRVFTERMDLRCGQNHPVALGPGWDKKRRRKEAELQHSASPAPTSPIPPLPSLCFPVYYNLNSFPLSHTMAAQPHKTNRFLTSFSETVIQSKSFSPEVVCVGS